MWSYDHFVDDISKIAGENLHNDLLQSSQVAPDSVAILSKALIAATTNTKCFAAIALKKLPFHVSKLIGIIVYVNLFCILGWF